MGLVLLVVIGGVLYFLPTFVSAMRSVNNNNGIFLLNLLLGWTVLGWLGSLIWACCAETKQQAMLREAAFRTMIASGQPALIYPPPQTYNNPNLPR